MGDAKKITFVIILIGAVMCAVILAAYKWAPDIFAYVFVVCLMLAFIFSGIIMNKYK